MAQFVMPSLGADMTEGTLLHWLVHPGDAVHPGDVVAEVDTTKAAIEVECFDEGVIGEILVAEGVTVPVGTALATIEPTAAGATVSAPPRPAGPDETDSARSAPETQSAAESPGPAGNGEVPDIRATPLVRRLAEEAGIDLRTVLGSAPGGRIVRADVARAAELARAAEPISGNAGPVTEFATPPPPPGKRGVRASGYARRLATESGIDLAAVTGSGPVGAIRAADVRAHSVSEVARQAPAQVAPESEPGRDKAAVRSLIAAAMTRSKRTVPHYYLSATIDMEAATRWLRAANLRAPVTERILAPALLLRATALAARKVPQLNGFWIDDEFRPAADVHLGFVVSLRGGGIIVPTVPHADTLTVPELMSALRGAVSRSRDGRLHAADATPATLTVTNLGELGVDSVYGVIAVPQVAIVGFGAIAERPCAVHGLLGVRPQLTATLSADHRASDGAIGARFLNTLSELLQHPEDL